MRLNDLFPSRYLKAADLHGREVACVISHVATELMEGQHGREQKAVVNFRGKEKGLVLNQVNANTIADAYGDETDDWSGCTIILYPTRTQFGSKMVDCVRIRVPVRTGAALPPTPIEEGDVADDTPF